MKHLLLIIILSAVSISAMAQFDDSGWQTLYQENFDSSFTAVDGQQFSQNNWLLFQLLNGGEISIENGYAQLNCPDFWQAALIRSTQILPEEYKIRTKIGYINYDLTNYETADYNNPDFNSHDGNYENGMYFLTITNDTCIGNECAEFWWHYHRKMVIDIDNHKNSDGSETTHPVYMVYMAPQTNAGGNLLRTWTGSVWDTSPWNWNIAYTYSLNSWYYAELEKKEGTITLRLYDGNKILLRETTPVSLSLVHGMSDSLEFLYLGEPHTDDYEGDVRIDEITLLVPGTECCIGIRGNVDGSEDSLIDISDLTYLVNYSFKGGTSPSCLEEADINGLAGVDISDIVYLVAFMFGSGPAPVGCN